jgi:hypothetical protein
VQAALERVGITTVSVTLLREITSVIKPPRALFVPFPLGFPLGTPNDAAQQHRVIAAALDLLPLNDVPLISNYE